MLRLFKGSIETSAVSSPLHARRGQRFGEIQVTPSGFILLVQVVKEGEGCRALGGDHITLSRLEEDGKDEVGIELGVDLLYGRVEGGAEGGSPVRSGSGGTDVGGDFEGGAEDRLEFGMDGLVLFARIGAADSGVELEIVQGGNDARFEVFDGGVEGVECGGGFVEVERGCVRLVGGLGVVVVVDSHLL